MLYEKLRVLLGAIPTWGAAVQGVLVAFAAGIVPLLPVDVGVKVGAAVAAAIAWIAGMARVVSSVTPVPSAVRGLEMPDGVVLDVTATSANGREIASIQTTR